MTTYILLDWSAQARKRSLHNNFEKQSTSIVDRMNSSVVPIYVQVTN